MQELGGRPGGHQRPDVVLADARRRADRIRRDAERDAARIRRDAAAWAADARAEAEAHRARIHAELDTLADVLESGLQPGVEVDATVDTGAGEEDEGEVIDLRAAAGVRGPSRRHRPVIETSLETKVHDVVRLALRHRFERSGHDATVEGPLRTGGITAR